jgi:hypothetical protein
LADLGLGTVHLGQLTLVVLLHALCFPLQLLILLVLREQLLVVLLVELLHLALMPAHR